MFDVREYDRLSNDRGGTSIARQRRENRAAQVEHGWSAGAPYSDDDRSASPYRRKEREDFERLLSDLEAGSFDARILQAYETSRLTRETAETVRLIQVCRAAQVKIYITQEERLYNLDNARDRKHLKDSANDDEYSSDQTSKRTGDTAALEAEKGRPYGFAPYGYKALYDNKTGRLITWIADDALAGYVRTESKAQVIYQLFKRLEEGHSLRRVARHFEACGYLNKSGNPFSAEQLRNMAIRPVYCGIRVHKGQEHQGVWEGLVTEELFRKVQRMLTDPSRQKYRSGKAKHEFTGVLTCGKCLKQQMKVRRVHTSGNPKYQCLNSCVSMLKDDVDEILTAKLIEYLSREDVYNALTARMGDDADVLKVRTALAVARADKQEMDKEVPKTLAETRVLARAIDGLETDIAALEAQERALTLPPALASLLGARGSIREAWFKAPIEACREIVRHVMVPDLLGQPIITGVSIGQRYTPPGERLQWEVE